MTDTLLLGAVAYDPKVVTIWDGFAHWFAARGLPFDYVLFTSYERQVAAHVAGHVDVAWNSPLAWLQTERAAKAVGLRARAIAMRDTDCDLASVLVTRARDGLKRLQDLAGKRVGVGAADSPQATLLPLLLLADAGLEPGRDFEVVRHDVLLGKHGDHIGGERDAARALLAGTVDAACVLDANHLLFTREGTWPPGTTHVLAATPRYDHCCFTVIEGRKPELVARFGELLASMSYGDPEVQPLLDLEGLKAWRPGRVSGYEPLARACQRFGTLEAFDPAAWVNQ